MSDTSLSDSGAINTGTHLKKTNAMAFETGSDITSTQVLYEQGGLSRGFNLFIKNGTLYASAWDSTLENWGYKELETAVQANTKYTATFEMDGTAANDGTAMLYLNGLAVDTATGLGQMTQQWGKIGIGQINDDTRINDVASDAATDPLAFTGTIDKILQYNAVLSGVDQQELEIFMADAWTSGTHLVYGGNDNDTLNGDASANVVHGYFGDDTLYGDSGADTLIGGLGADTFVFKAATAYADLDELLDFSTAEGDRLDLSDLLPAGVSANLTDYVQITDDGTDSTVAIDSDGTANGVAFTAIATLKNVTGLTDEDQLYTDGTLLIA